MIDDGADGAGWPEAAHPEKLVAELYRDHCGFLLSYVSSLLGDRHLAEDVVQETMLRAWRKGSALCAERGSVRGWLVRVAHNVAVDSVRMRRSRPSEVAQEWATEELTADHADAVVSALYIRDVLAVLSRGQREVLELVYLDGCTARDTAARLGIAEGTVFSRAHYGLKVLRRELVA